MKITTLALSAVVASGFATATLAQSMGNLTGYVGGSYIYSDVTDDNSNNTSSSAFVLEGAGAMSVANNITVAVDLTYRIEDYSGGSSFSNGPSGYYNVGLHGLYDFGSGYKAGVFLGYGHAENNNGSGFFDVLYYGLEGHANLSSSVFAYGQVGFGDLLDSTGSDSSSRGFQNGYMVRIGAGYQYSTNTIFTLDIEYAGVPDGIEDTPEAGILYGITLGGETGITSMPLTVNYFIRADHWEAEGDIAIDEISAGVGVRYYFGGGNTRDAFNAGIAGTPRLATASGGWISVFD